MFRISQLSNPIVGKSSVLYAVLVGNPRVVPFAVPAVNSSVCVAVAVAQCSLAFGVAVEHSIPFAIVVGNVLDTKELSSYIKVRQV